MNVWPPVLLCPKPILYTCNSWHPLFIAWTHLEIRGFPDGCLKGVLLRFHCWFRELSGFSVIFRTMDYLERTITLATRIRFSWLWYRVKVLTLSFQTVQISSKTDSCSGSYGPFLLGRWFGRFRYFSKIPKKQSRKFSESREFSKFITKLMYKRSREFSRTRL